MDNPLFLITKGLKMKKKRLGGGGSPQFVQPIVDSSRVGLSIGGVTASSAFITLRSIQSGIFAANGNNFVLLGYDDYAHASVASGTPLYTHNGVNYNGSLNVPSISADEDFVLVIENTGTLSSTYTNPTNFTFSILQDTNNLIGNSVNESGGNGFPFTYTAGKNNFVFSLDFDSATNGGVTGEILLEIKAPNSTTSSAASILVAKNATAKDAYYLKINVV